MEPVPAPPFALWHVAEGNAPHLERLAEVAVRQQLRDRSGEAGARLVAPVVAGLGLVMTFLASPVCLAFVALGGFL